MFATAADADVYYVKQYSSPPASPNGLSWPTAFPSIEAAFASVDFSDDDELWVAASGAAHYVPTANATASDPRTVHYRITLNNFSMKGGFPSNPPAGWDERDLTANPTVLSGDLENDDPVFDPDAIMYPDARAESLVGNPPSFVPLGNAYHVIEAVGVNDTCLIDGFVIRDGHDWDGSTPEVGELGYKGIGGGVLLRSDSPGDFASPFIQNCKFFDNFAARAGGAIADLATKIEHPDGLGSSYEVPADYDSLLQIRTCEFRGNWAGNEGGGAIAVSRGGLDVAGTLIADNRANRFAGGIFAAFPNPLRLTNCTVTNNSSVTSNPSGVAVELSQWQPVETPGLFVVRNSIVSGNFDYQPSGRFSNQLTSVGQEYTPNIDFSIVYQIDNSFGEGNQSTLTESPDFFFDSDNTNVFDRDYRVTITSWCGLPIDRGDPESMNLPIDERDADDDGFDNEALPDVRLAERVQEGLSGGCPRVDVGAYEMNRADLPTVCFSDLDLDGSVGASDLALLLGAWADGGLFPPCISECCPADLDADGWVAASDLAALLGAWGPCPESCLGALAAAEPDAAMLGVGEELALSPQTLSAFMGFESLESFAWWLGSLSPESRAAVLAGLSGAEGQP